MMMTLPSPRYKFYQNSDANKIKADVFDYTNNLINALGFWSINTGMPILERME